MSCSVCSMLTRLLCYFCCIVVVFERVNVITWVEGNRKVWDEKMSEKEEKRERECDCCAKWMTLKEKSEGYVKSMCFLFEDQDIDLIFIFPLWSSGWWDMQIIEINIGCWLSFLCLHVWELLNESFYLQILRGKHEHYFVQIMLSLWLNLNNVRLHKNSMK